VRRLITIALFAVALPACASDALQWSGFALVRPQTQTDGVPLDDDALSAQVQLGIDWRPSLTLGGHLHLLARNQSDGARRGRAGIVEAWLEQNVARGDDRIHLLEGAFFLPTSRENVDALWESPYTMTPSALNSWLGEELRPIGIDASYTRRHILGGSATGGVTLFTGNDTFGALPVERGWAMHDQWALLGQHTVVERNPDYYTSVSAETDHRLGWSARARWNNDHATLQFTRIDNRSDARAHGELFNWATRFDIVGADYTLNDWTFAAESGWGVTTIDVFGPRYSTDIRTAYVLASRRFANARVSVRGENFQNGADHGHAITAAFFWQPPGHLRTGIEAIAAHGDRRVALELRYSFAGR
jgi:hypothetical protein